MIFFCHAYEEPRKLRVTSPDKQVSMHAPLFGTQSKQSSKQPLERDESLHIKFEIKDWTSYA